MQYGFGHLHISNFQTNFENVFIYYQQTQMATSKPRLLLMACYNRNEKHVQH